MEKIEKEKIQKTQDREETLIRILSTDIPGNASVYAGLTKIFLMLSASL